jgi:hypothetical protein
VNTKSATLLLVMCTFARSVGASLDSGPASAASQAGEQRPQSPDAVPEGFPADLPFVPGGRAFDMTSTNDLLRQLGRPDSAKCFLYDEKPTALAVKYQQLLQNAKWSVDLAPATDPASPAVRYRITATKKKRRVGLSVFQTSTGVATVCNRGTPVTAGNRSRGAGQHGRGRAIASSVNGREDW